MRRQDQEHEEDAQREDVDARVACDDLLEGEFGPIQDHALGQTLLREFLDERLGLAGAETRGGRAIDVGGGIPVVAHDPVGPVGLMDAGEPQRHDLAGLVAGLEPEDVLGVLAGNWISCRDTKD